MDERGYERQGGFGRHHGRVRRRFDDSRYFAGAEIPVCSRDLGDPKTARKRRHRAFLDRAARYIGGMADDDSLDNEPQPQDEIVILSAEESALAELLAELEHGDWARILFRLSPTAKDEIRSAIGTLQAEASYREENESRFRARALSRSALAIPSQCSAVQLRRTRSFPSAKRIYC